MSTTMRIIAAWCRSFVLVAAGLLVASGCEDQLPESVGPNQEILVLADPADWEFLEAPLKDVFEKPIHTPQEERIYRIQRGDVEQFEEYRHHRRKNLLVAAPVDAPHATAGFLRGLLDPEVLNSARAGEYSFSAKEDVWAQEQVFMVLTGRDRDALVDNLRMEADRIYRIVDEARDRRIRKLIYRYGERKNVTAELAETYGWSVRVPFGYRILEAYPDSGFVALAKEEPSRWLFVYWEDGVPPDRLTADWCIQKRDDITRRLFDGDRIAQGEVETSQTEFAGKLAVVLQGLWENEKKWTGGPFKSYAFVDVYRNRFYFVDVGVFSPNREKEPYLRQVDLMAQTFSFADSVATP